MWYHLNVQAAVATTRRPPNRITIIHFPLRKTKNTIADKRLNEPSPAMPKQYDTVSSHILGMPNSSASANQRVKPLTCGVWGERVTTDTPRPGLEASPNLGAAWSFSREPLNFFFGEAGPNLTSGPIPGPCSWSCSARAIPRSAASAPRGAWGRL